MPENTRIPLFPLSLVLFPRQVLPLHIFEDRYREMVKYCLEHGVAFGVVGMKEDRMEVVGCTARITNVVTTYDDGRVDIETVGERRFRIQSLHEEFPYLTADTTPILDRAEQVSIEDRERLVALHMKLMEFGGEKVRPADYRDNTLLSFQLAPSVGLDFRAKQQLLEADTESERIKSMVQHLQTLVPRLQTEAERRDRVRSNGHFH